MYVETEWLGSCRCGAVRLSKYSSACIRAQHAWWRRYDYLVGKISISPYINTRYSGKYKNHLFLLGKFGSAVY
jgi:hypothetical protein